MNNSKSIMFVLIVALFTSYSGIAGTVEVVWQQPDKYSDIRQGEQNQKYFRDNLFYNLENILKKLAEKLPEQQTLKLTVTDIDLAGEIRMGGGDLYRIVEQIYSPRIKFSYQLLDQNKAVIKQGQENFRDISFLNNQNLRYKSEQFGFEKHLFEKWFKRTLAQQ